MSPGLETLNELAVQFLLTLLAMCVALCAAAGLLALAAEALRRGASRWLAQARAPRSFYVGRLEGARAAVYLVDRELVRLLFETTPSPDSWARISDGLARTLACDATGADELRPRDVRRVARRLAQAPPDGFVIERRALAALASRSPAHRWAHRVRAVLGGSRLRRALVRCLRAWADRRPVGARRTAGPARGGQRAAP